jgi:tetratricopeptide (TPR) repeat protein
MIRRLSIIAVSTYLLAVAVFFASNRLYPPSIEGEVRVVPPAEIVRAMSLGHEGFAADLLLAKLTIHSGSLMWKPLRLKFDHEWAYGTADLITDLDPRFFKAYLFSAMGLIHEFEDVKRARPIVEKGMQVFPQRWELPFWIGYDYYAYFQDYETAAKYLWKAYKLPDSPKSFLALMLSTLRNAGDYEKALQVIKKMYDQAQNESLKMVYAKRMAQLENLLALQKAARTYRRVRGHLPESVQTMVQEGLLPKVPEDPFGMPYKIDKDSDALVVLGGKKRHKGSRIEE